MCPLSRAALGREKLCEDYAMEKPLVIEGRAWVVRDSAGNAIDDIDTDQIYHNAHLAVTELAEMGKFAFGNLRGWENFPKKAEPGDLLVCGKNFGSGSSRQQAVDCFRALGLALMICESFGAIYKRNAINSGFPILTCPGICEMRLEGGRFAVASQDRLRVNLLSGEVLNLTTGASVGTCEPFSRVQLDVYKAGNLFAYGRSLRLLG